MSERSSSVPLIVRAAMSASMSNRSHLLRMPPMPDLLTTYAQLQPDKLAVVDDRLGDDVRTVTYAEFERVTNQLAHVLRDHGVGPGVKVVWCGQNSMGIANLVVAARKVGATAVPLNYRLSDEEAAYVTDHSDATVVYVDAELRAAVRAHPRRDPRRSPTSSCSTAPRPPG